MMRTGWLAFSTNSDKQGAMPDPVAMTMTGSKRPATRRTPYAGTARTYILSGGLRMILRVQSPALEMTDGKALLALVGKRVPCRLTRTSSSGAAGPAAAARRRQRRRIGDSGQRRVSLVAASRTA